MKKRERYLIAMISFTVDDKKFNFRVGAIIIDTKSNKVLLNTIEGFGFYLLPGGRVEWMENSTEAIKRELDEEIGLKNIDPKYIGTLENFFNFKGVNFHEISNNFVIYLDENNSIPRDDEFRGLEGDKHIYRWVSIEDIDKVKLQPSVLAKMIKNVGNEPKLYELQNNEEI